MTTLHNRVGLGTFPLANVFSEITSRGAEKIVKTFIDNGGYYIHTAPMYGFGEVEKLLGKALKGYSREKFYLITMCGYKDVEGKTFKTIPRGATYEEVIRECDISLARLKQDFIDLYFIHSPDPSTPFEETMKALNKLKKIGKIKSIGVSNVNLSELKEYRRYGKVDFIQNRFSLINRSIDGEFANYLLENKILLIPYQVIDRGQLTGKALEGFPMRSEDLRIGRSDWLPEKKDLVAKWVKDRLAPIAKHLGITIGQLSIAWALHQKYIGFVLVGTTNVDYLLINLKADNVKLTSTTLKNIESAYKSLELDIQRKYGQPIREVRGLNEKYY